MSKKNIGCGYFHAARYHNKGKGFVLNVFEGMCVEKTNAPLAAYDVVRIKDGLRPRLLLVPLFAPSGRNVGSNGKVKISSLIRRRTRGGICYVNFMPAIESKFSSLRRSDTIKATVERTDLRWLRLSAAMSSLIIILIASSSLAICLQPQNPSLYLVPWSLLVSCPYLYLTLNLSCALYPRLRKLQRGRLVPCSLFSVPWFSAFSNLFLSPLKKRHHPWPDRSPYVKH